MFKITTDEAEQTFVSDSEHWKPNTHLADSSKIRLLAVVEENPKKNLIGRLFRKKSIFVHDTSFPDIVIQDTDFSEEVVMQSFFSSFLFKSLEFKVC